MSEVQVLVTVPTGCLTKPLTHGRLSTQLSMSKMRWTFVVDVPLRTRITAECVSRQALGFAPALTFTREQLQQQLLQLPDLGMGVPPGCH